MAGQTTLRRRLDLALLRARDPNALTFEESYELYRDSFARDLRAANRAFEREQTQARPPGAIHVTFGAALLIAIMGFVASFDRMPADCGGWSRNGGRAPALILGLLLGAGALPATRSFAAASER
jgi:hypothetical protein